jgi:3-oxoacyl-[acyl-carrier-protein] synthase II
MNLKRVVITGLGAVTPIGNNVSDYWNSLLTGVNGANLITRFDTELYKTKFACELKGFDVLDYLDNKEARKMDPCSHYAIAATAEAIADSQLDLSKTDLAQVSHQKKFFINFSMNLRCFKNAIS